MEKLTRREFVLAASLGGMAALCGMLVLAVLLVAAGVVPLGQKPATVVNVVPQQPKPTTPRDTQPEPPNSTASEELPQWAEKFVEQMAEHQRLAERQRTQPSVALGRIHPFPKLNSQPVSCQAGPLPLIGLTLWPS